MAPEVLNQCYTDRCDIWSCGVMLFILLTGIPPFNGKEDVIFRKIRLGKFSFKHQSWNNISQKAKDFITLLLTYDYNERPSAAEAL